MVPLKFYFLPVLCICSSGFTFSNELKNNAKSNNLLYYEDILEAQKDKTILIIDIREDSEIRETGKLPGSIHIPMGKVINVLTECSNEEFEKQYNRTKPTFDTKIILSCLKGLRSGKLLPKMLQLGFRNMFSYAGGWMDWVQHQKQN
ncbi:thiosulfate sulfurtransferase/rhodanese-like domain-containing protein 3 [Phymastichus coffea]|uniref:thiosulfate sulfurtransferase/rhodanese-like domain-containing protein 3 n=1 Tax=Phymastichus coffea TaxID=108790 RepID=UPI00273C29A4|nr:thiosulfate sulfurtransferase/rhodanese-like domain-containing protein 3 [Phymastichus coffea]